MSKSLNEQGKKLWGGRFAVAPDEAAAAFTASIMFDNRMVREDIRGSVAHVRMLGRQNIIPAEDAALIEDGLWTIWQEVEDDKFSYSVADEDIHSAVERRLRELIGPAQGKLHTGRSRNDQVATDARLWTKGAILRVEDGLLSFMETLLNLASASSDTVLPGYTHTQRAQPVLLAHHFLAYVEMLLRDLERLQQAFDRLDRSPLGSGALAGVTYPIDRESVADDLGFSGISANSMDAIADRDFVLDTLYALTMVQLHCSRLAEELIYWSSGEFRFVQIDDAFATGSSIMPQKKNADVAELARGRTGRVVGNLTGLLTTMKGLPLTYNSDMQEDKEALFETVDTVTNVLAVMSGMVATLKINGDRMAEAATGDFSLATDAADLLARNGIAFREAHEIVGNLVRMCIETNRTFEDLSEEEWAEIHPVFADQRPPLNAMESVSARDIPGGTAPNQVARALSNSQDRLTAERSALNARQGAIESVLSLHSGR